MEAEELPYAQNGETPSKHFTNGLWKTAMTPMLPATDAASIESTGTIHIVQTIAAGSTAKPKTTIEENEE
jgi:hypothetical protein